MGPNTARRAWAAACAPSETRVLRSLCHARTRQALAAFAVAFTSILAGCGGSGGFQPLYGTGATGERIAVQLASLDIAPIPGRVGQRIRNELIFERSAAGEAKPATKRVEIKLTESVITNGVQISGDSTSQTYQVEAVYRIVDIATGKVDGEGRSVARANYERFAAIYANVRAREDAENRAARVISSDLKTRLAVHLSRG